MALHCNGPNSAVGHLSPPTLQNALDMEHVMRPPPPQQEADSDEKQTTRPVLCVPEEGHPHNGSSRTNFLPAVTASVPAKGTALRVL